MHLNFGKSCLQRTIQADLPCIQENDMYNNLTYHMIFSQIPCFMIVIMFISQSVANTYDLIHYFLFFQERFSNCETTSFFPLKLDL